MPDTICPLQSSMKSRFRHSAVRATDSLFAGCSVIGDIMEASAKDQSSSSR